MTLFGVALFVGFHLNVWGVVRLLLSKVDWQALMNAGLQAAVQTIIQIWLKA